MSLEVSHSARGLKAVAEIDARVSVDLDGAGALPSLGAPTAATHQLDLFSTSRTALPVVGPASDLSPAASTAAIHDLGAVGGPVLNAGLPAISTGQLWFGVVGGGGELGVGHFNNAGNTFTEYAPATAYNGKAALNIGLDTAAGFYFTGNGDNLTISVHRISDGGIVQTLKIANDFGTATQADDELSQAIAVDPITHVIYAGLWGSTPGAGGNTGILQISYDPATGLMNTNAAYNVPTGTRPWLVHGTNSGVYAPIDPRSMDLDAANHRLYFVDNTNNYTDANFTQPTNGVFVVDTQTKVVSQLTLDSQFHFNTGNDPSEAYARVGAVAVNSAHNVVYFTTYQTHADGTHNQFDGLWEMSTSGGTAVKILGSSAALHYVEPQAGLVYDAQNNQLFLSDGQVTAPTDDRHIVQLQLTSAGTTLDTAYGAGTGVVGTYGIDQLVGHTADPNAYTSGLAFNELPILGLNGTFSHVGEQNVTPVDLTSVLTTADADGGYLKGAVVKVSGGTFSNTANDSTTSDDHLGFISGGTLLSSGTTGTNNAITYSYNAATETLTLSGYATLADYQAALGNIGFSSTGDNPTNYGSNTTRTISWSLDDGTVGGPTNGQNTGSQTITIDAVNDAAAITGADPAALTETNAGLTAGGTLTITDADTQANNMLVASVSESGTVSGISNATLLTYLTLGASSTSHVPNATSSTDTYSFNSAGQAFNYLAPGQTLTLTYVVTGTDANDSSSVGSHNVVVTINGTNDAPAGTDATLTALEDTARVFSAADFGLTDVDGGALGGVKFTTVPGAGQVLLNGVAVTAGQTVSASEINAGHLTYLSGSNGNGTGYASLAFQVQDNQGTANGGVDLDPSANTLTFNVTAVNDAPDLTPNAPTATTFTENGAAVQLLSGAAVSDPDAPGNFGGGSFEAKITAGAVSGDSIVLLGSSGFHITGSTLFDSFSTNLGQVSGANSTDVTVTFSSAVNANVAGQIARAFGFQNSTDNPGSGDRTLTYTLNDGGNTGTGGALTDTVNQTVHVAAVNDAPAINSLSDQTVVEDQAGPLNGFVFSDVDANGAVETATFSVTAGSLAATSGGGVTVTGSGASLTLSGTLTNINAYITGNHLTFQGAANATGDVSLSVTLNDGGASGSGGAQQASQTVTIHTTAVNDAPSGSNGSATILEDAAYTFTTTDFGFSDPNDSPANSLLAVKISSLPANGSLALNGVAVTLNQFVQASEIAAGHLVFTPAANANGAGYGSFTFQVQDDGGTASGGVDLDQSANTFTLNVTAVNDAPSGASNTVTTLEDTSHVFAASEFGFTDALDGNSLQAVKIGTISGSGSLLLNGVAVTAGQSVSASEINAGHLIFTPAANANGAGYGSFTFQVQDNGGTSNGGVDTDPTARTMTVDVTSVNDAPSAADKTITTIEDSAYTFAASDFGFSDSDGNSLQAVKIDVLPTGGSLTLNGSAVTAGQLVAASDIGGLVFTPGANLNGPAESTITFQVQDNGGVANGGTDLSTAKTITFDVTPVNDAPTAADKTITTLEDTAYTFSTSDFGFSDSDGNSLLAVKIGTISGGALAVNGTAVNAGDTVAAADLANLVFTPAADANGAGEGAVTFQVQDNGGTANGGVDLSTTKTITFDVTSVNDAPSAADKTIGVNEDAPYTFAANDFGFSDSDGNSLLAVKIGTISGGALALNGTAVNAGDTVAAADLTHLVFTPTADANGAGEGAVTFQVQDNGGVANGGVDLSATKTITFDVTAVNDAPSGADKTIGINEDAPYTFAANDFGFSDSDGNSLLAVKIGTISGGALALNGTAVNTGDTVAAADLTHLVFTPTADANGAGEGAFTFQVQDDGGVANGGVDLSTAKTITFDVASVNDAPTAADKTIATNEDQAYTFSASDFGFSDSDGNSLQAVKITTVPGPGTLTLNGSAVAAGDFVQAADIGNLVWFPPGDGHGAALASFTFQVQDDGGTAHGGADLSAAKTITFNVAAVNDDPVVNAGIAAHNVFFDDAFAFFIGASAFADVDGDTLTYSAVVNLGGGATQALPGWLTFDGATGKFTGTPPKSDIGVLDIQVTANDGHGGSVATDFNLTIVGNQTINGTPADETLRGHNGDDVINGNGGHDTLIGSDGNDTLSGGASADQLKGGAGDDVLRGGGGGDDLNGGSGNDVVLYYDSATGVHIDLLNQANNAGGAAGDNLTFVERIGGSSHDDVLIGGATRNWFKGANGDDALSGSGSSDTLRGGDGADTLHGGGGHDLLLGGAGADTFDFSSVADSGRMNSDLITDFSTAEGDKLDLSLLDGNAGTPLDFIGTARFDGHGPEVRYVQKNGETYVSADLNGDKHADFQVRLVGAVTLHDGDFVL